MTDPRTTDRVENVAGDILDAKAGAYDAALFEDNLWWTDEAVARLVGQRPRVIDANRHEASNAYRVVRAWKQDGMICVRLEPDTSGER
jgi:hypothetical protein